MMRTVRVWLAAFLCAALASPLAAAPPRGRPAHAASHAGRAAAQAPGGPLSTVLMEVSTGRVLESADPHRRIPPASLDKLMTLYLTLRALRAGRLSPDTHVTVSAQAWRVGRTPGSSRMFLNVGDVVTVRQLLAGLMVASGNDAAEALAETVGGSSEQFVAMMNAEAVRLGMHDTHYVTPHGLPVPGEYTSAWDVALLARQILVEFPDITRVTGERYETYARIRQANWNNLVFRDPHVDGLKTGHTDEAGYSIAATADEDGMRLLVVVLGSPTLRRRTQAAEGLLAEGFSRYALVPVPWQRVVPAAFRVYGGTAAQVRLAPERPVNVLVRRGVRTPLAVSETLTARPFAPIARGQRLGDLTVSDGGRDVLRVPLVAADAVGRAGFFGRLWGVLRYEAGRLLHRHPASSRGAVTLPG